MVWKHGRLFEFLIRINREKHGLSVEKQEKAYLVTSPLYNKPIWQGLFF